MKKRVIQLHHEVYPNDEHPTQAELTMWLYKGEHFLIGRMKQMCKKTVSKGFIKCLKLFIAAREDESVELKPEENN